MDKQIRDISKKRTWKRILRRSVALLCAVVMLFTMNTLKRNADTLEHIPMCGYAEHVHSASCFSGDVLVCGMEEHVHTDACYQTRPSDDVEVLTIDSDEDIPVEEVDVELGDLVLDVDVGDLVLDEPGALTVNESASTEEEKYFILGESAKVSTIIKELELGIKRKQIEAVGAIENDEEHIGLIRVDALEKDWLVSAAKDFDEAELAIVLADDIVVVKLKDGRVSEDLDTPVEEQIDIEAPAVDEQIEQTVVDEQEPVIEEQPIEVKQIEVPSVEESAQPAEVQAQPAEDEMPVEETVPAEEASPEEEQPAEEEPEQSAEEQSTEKQSAEEDAPAEEASPEEEQTTEEAPPAEKQLTEESAPVEGEQSDEESTPVEEQPAEAELSTDDEHQPAEDAEVTAEETAPAEGAEALAELPTDDEQSGYEQPVVPVEEQGEEGALTEEQGEVDEGAVPAEEQGEDGQQPEVVAPVDEEQGEDAASAEENEETTPAEEQGEDAQQAEEVAPVEEEQGEDAQQPEEDAPVDEEQGEDAQQAEETAPVDEEQGEDARQAEETASVDEEQTEDAAPGEDYEEATSAEEEGEEDDQSEVATPANEQGEDAEQSEEAEAEEGQSEEQGEQQPDEQGEQLPDEQGGDAEQLEEGEAEEGQLEEQSGQLPDEQGEDAEQSEEAEAEEGQPEEQGEQQPEAQTYTATIDLTDVETYPLSLNAMLTAATPEQEEIEEEAIDGESQEDQAEEQTTLTIEYDEALLEVVEQDGDYLVTPIQSFESTQIIVNNGSRYELTLVNCVLATDEKVEDEGEQQEEAQDVPAYTATIDLTDATYPLSLNEMITAATPEQGDYEEAQEDQAEEQPEEQPTLTIDYDEALLEVVEQDGDYLVRPVQSFESTQIIVTNGSRYELTLVNCVLKAEEQEEQSVPVHTATIDLTNATYPLSLNELITGVAPGQAESEQPEEQPEIEQSEAQNEQQVEEQPTLTIDYDEALLEIVESDGDWLVTPVQSFESTQITVTNGSRYELTLVNCVLTDGEQEEQEVIYPAKTFEGHTDYVKVSVTAPEGAFPEGTTMTVADVEDEQTITDIEETVSENFVEVKRVHAVDISFWNGETEIEPLVPISVVITVAEIEEQQDAVVVHVDNEGATEVVESQSEAPAGETEVTVEMPASEAGSAPSDAEKQGEEQPAEDSESPEEEQTDAVAFEADSFSVYAVVVTETIETKYIDAEGETWNISVGFTKEANIPAGAKLDVAEVESESYLPEAEAALEGGKRVTMARFFDISIVDTEGNEVQPEVPVTVNICLDNTEIESIEATDHVIDNSDPVAVAMHFEGKDDSISVDVKETTETGEAVVFDADGFSVYGVVYTVDFYYGDYEYHLPGEGYITLSDLFGKLEIDADAAQAKDVVFSNPELVAVVKVEEDTTLSAILAELGLDEVPVAEVDVELGEESAEETESSEYTTIAAGNWLLVSLAPFDTEEKLTLTMEDGAVYEIRVEDNAQYTIHIRSNDVSGGYLSGKNTDNNSTNITNGSNVVGFDIAANAGVYNVVAHANENYSFVNWITQAGTISTGSRYTSSNQFYLSNTTIEAATEETTYIAYYRPSSAKLIIVLPSDYHGSVTGQLRIVDNNTSLPQYCYSTDNTTLYASAGTWPYFFKGWYADGECISTSNAFDVSTVTEDIVITPVYEEVYRYYFKANETYKGIFSIPGWNGWNDWKNGYEGEQGEGQVGLWKFEGRNLPSEVVPNEGVTSFEFPVQTLPQGGSGYEFVYWLRDDGAAPITDGSDLCGFKNANGVVRDHYNELTRNTTYVAFYKPQNDYIVRLNWAAEGGSTEESADISLRAVHDDITNKDIFWYHYAIMDKATIVAKPTYDQNNPENCWAFVGWFHNGTELISDQATLNLTEYYQNIITSGGTPRDLNLTPVFKRVDPHFHVWFDGTNGVGGGGNPANNTFYTRITSKNDIIGSTSVFQRVEKRDAGTDNPYAIITLPTTAVAPQGVGQNKFALQGWYCVYPGVCEAIEGQTEITDGKCYKPGTQVKITGDAVFYADWFPVDSDYSISKNTDIATNNLSTSRFITTRVFDYNNLFNMNSIYLNQGQSVIPTVDADGNWQKYNKEYWYMNGKADDFIFLSTVSGQGRSLNPFGRDYKNQNREISTNGGYYTGTRTTELLSSNLKNRLFGTSDGLGKRYLGKADKLYSYDSDTGYFYYDSDKNAASYNKAAQQFYVYDYTNKTNKSNGGDNTDFMPFNYGETTFTEAYGEPNYWFGMSSEINFFLPNAVSADNSNNPVNFSDHDREMVYKFAGDDDVWVYVDDQLILDMGGVHGKIYGEINFSRGTWQIAQEGTERIWDDDGILSYDNNGNLSQHGFINLSEGDHTLTLYYLERGASQSNCAIYFNIAPRYGLRFIKQDDRGNNLGDIRFGVYTDPECTIAADLNNNSGAKTNEFFDGDHNGMTHARNLVAGRTYYIKEIKAPNGYPDMSSHIIKLELDAHGKAKITPPADATWMVNTTGLTEVANETGTYYLGKVTGEPDMYLLTVVNKKETSITASKTWAMLDGSTFVAVTGKNTDANTNATAKIKLQRRVLAEAGTPGAVQMGNHKVKLVTRYFVDGSGTPSNRDNTGLKQVRAATYSVKDNNDLSFTLNAPSGSGIYSVVASSGNLTASNVSGSSGTLYINGGTGTKPTTGTYTLSGVQSDAVIYITFIGTGTPSAPSPNISDNKDARWVVEDTDFNESQTEENGGIETLNSANDWTTTWVSLESSDASGKTYYYYVTEVGGSTANIPEGQFATSFISTTSSDGLSSGTIMVNNTLQSVRVMLRKRDAVKPDGKNVYLSGGKYELHIGSVGGSLYSPSSNALDNSSMGSNNGAELTGDNGGRFYTGYLPEGTYYLVEKEAPEGYEPTTARQIVVNESGVSWDRDGNGNLVEAPLDSNGYYSLYLNNTVQKGSILIQKLWKSESNYGLTNVYANAYSTGEFGLDNSKLYSVSDNGATAVLLSLGAVVDGAMNADVVNEVLNDPGSYGLTDKVVEVNGKKYIRLKKEQNGTWPALAITNLPLKHRFVQNEAGVSKDIWFFIEEYGYYDANSQLVLVANKTVNWTVSYGFANGTTNGTGKTETISERTYNLVKPKTSNPDTLTVTNGFKGGLEFTKMDGSGHPLEGAVFQIIPNGAGEGNYITGADAMLTSDSNGKVTISGLPAGTYWMWEKSAPDGYRKSDALYCLVIGYPNSHMYLADGSSRTETYAIDNTPVGSISIAKTVQVGGVDSTELVGQSITFGLFDSQPTAGSTASQTYTMTLGQTATTTAEAFTGLHMGTYWVYEVDADNHPILDGGTIIVNGKAYTVSEATPNVTLESAGDSKTVSITNNYSTIDIPVMKIWDGNSKPACVISVDFTMYTDATYNTVAKDIYGVDAVVTLSSDNGWKSTFTNLPEKDSTGATIQYYLKETKVTCKVIDAATGVETTSEVTGDAITDMFGAVLGTYTGTNGDAQSVYYRTITNTRQYTSVDVEKVWSNGTWPEKVSSVQVTLKANNEAAKVTVASNQNAATVTLTKATENAPNANKAAWTHLPKYDYDGNGDLITYTVEETAVTYDGTTYTSTSDIPLSDLFQITMIQPTDGHATITNQLKQTTIHVLKRNAETQIALAGAVFTLERKNGNGVYVVYGDPQTSGNDGTLAFANLPDGDYRLEETGIPAGYARTGSGRYIYFKIAEGVVTWDDTPIDAIRQANDSVAYSADENNQFTVDNTPGVSLPSTGGPGTTIIYAVGIGLIAMAIFGLILRRRKARDVIE